MESVFLGLRLVLGLDERMRSVEGLLRVCMTLMLSSLFEFVDILDLGRRFAIVMLMGVVMLLLLFVQSV